jgi:uncharacterized protein (TIGR00725 family)
MGSEQKFKIGVFGSAGGSELDKCKTRSFTIGRAIAQNNGILCTGACPGLPHEAALGAERKGGLVLGFSPAMNLADHVGKFKFPTSPYVLVFTGMGLKGRNLICTRTCDAAIFIAGRHGTLNEFTLVYDEGEGKVIGLLEGSGGFVDSVIIPSLETTEKPSQAKIVSDRDPEALVRKIFEALRG